MHRIFIADEPARAHLVKGALESEGIPAEVRGDRFEFAGLAAGHYALQLESARGLRLQLEPMPGIPNSVAPLVVEVRAAEVAVVSANVTGGGRIDGHVRMADVEYLVDRGVALVVGQPSWEEADPTRTSYRLSEMVRFYPVADLNELPAEASVIEIPLTGEKVWRVIYLTPHDRVDAAIAERGWAVFPVERRCDGDDLSGPLLSPEWIDRQGADLTCPDLS